MPISPTSPTSRTTLIPPATEFTNQLTNQPTNKQSKRPNHEASVALHQPALVRRVCVARWIKALPAVALDGELWLGRGRFGACMSIVKRHDEPQAWADITSASLPTPLPLPPAYMQTLESRRRKIRGVCQGRGSWTRANGKGGGSKSRCIEGVFG